MTSIAATRRSAPVTTKNKIGLALAALLGVADLVGLAIPTDSGEAGPPLVVLIIGAVLGVLTLAAAVYTWRTGNRIGARVVAGTRILSTLGALPAFFVPGVPAGLVAGVAVQVVLTVTAIVLVLSRAPRS
ncbi:hypothetical protein [Cryptosporangium phraense]|uniref:Integral membrane protein n=1 Tax=Cryptosporangium phraense TaxID=2593070 RepID=A0A545AIA7_9ACTN|nr:hypothetical protein [Cryptosporangium phraense]TQS41051.1 hypothetical protein FL583_31305 [Cryptosporangium phraense]